MKRFRDLFSNHAVDYASYRPTYPDAMVDYLTSLAPRGRMAWEAGCGSGQLTRLLATRFERVAAQDASAEQLANAPQFPNVAYLRAAAEQSRLSPASVDLAVAAQAAHWFDLDAYYEEVRRVGRPGGVVALITYNLIRVDPQFDAVVDTFYPEVLGPYWPEERKHVEDGYRSLPFPFEEIESPSFEMRATWSLNALMGYINSWSGVRALVRAEGRGPVLRLRSDLKQVWGAERTRSVRWPVAMRVGRVD